MSARYRNRNFIAINCDWIKIWCQQQKISNLQIILIILEHYSRETIWGYHPVLVLKLISETAFVYDHI